MGDEVSVKAREAVARLDAAELIKPFAGPDLPLVEEAARVIAAVFRPLWAEKDREIRHTHAVCGRIADDWHKLADERSKALIEKDEEIARLRRMYAKAFGIASRNQVRLAEKDSEIEEAIEARDFAEAQWREQCEALERHCSTCPARMDEAHEHALTIERAESVMLADLVRVTAERDAALKQVRVVMDAIERCISRMNEVPQLVTRSRCLSFVHEQLTLAIASPTEGDKA